MPGVNMITSSDLIINCHEEMFNSAMPLQCSSMLWVFDWSATGHFFWLFYACLISCPLGNEMKLTVTCAGGKS